MKYLILQVSGGIGKNVAATSLINNLKAKYPDREIVILTAWPAVFMHHPLIYRIFHFNSAPYFYDTFIKDQDFKFLIAEPYYHDDYLTRKTHLINAWYDKLDLSFAEPANLQINLRQEEVDNALAYVNQKGKPIFLLHVQGGPADNPGTKTWPRGLPIPIAQSVVQQVGQDFFPIQMRLPQQPAIPNVESFIATNLREAFALIYVSKLRLFIDSFSQHVAAAFNKQSVVLWGPTDPKILGYNTHINLIPPEKQCGEPFCHRPNSYMFDNDPNGLPWTCPYDIICMKQYNPDVILQALSQTLKQENA